MPEMTTAKTKTERKWHTQPSLSAFLAGHGVRYRWVGFWPAIPVKLGQHDPDLRREPTKVRMVVNNVEHFQEVPPDAPPVWVDRIHERFFEKVLWFKNNKSLKSIEFLDAAIYGFLHAAASVARVGKIYETLPSTEDTAQARCRTMHRKETEDAERQNQELVRGMCERRLADVKVKWPPDEAAAYQRGFDYGAKCQRWEEGKPRPLSIEKVQIYQAMALNFREVESLVRQGAAARVIGERIANRIVLASGMTKAQYFEKFPAKKKGEVLTYRNGGQSIEQHVFTKLDLRIAARHSAKGKFLRLFEKVCQEIELKLRPRGRPKK